MQYILVTVNPTFQVNYLKTISRRQGGIKEKQATELESVSDRDQT